MKLIIQIPCFNEEKTLPVTLKALPKKIKGIDKIEYLIIDDGSSDRTIETAIENGVDHIVRLSGHLGLARAFMAGIEGCIKLGADIIVNTDADNQYFAGDIKNLIGPIIKGDADIVVGARPIEDVEHFSAIKKVLQKIGSWVVRIVSGTKIPDAPSGFRALSRDAACQLNVFSNYTYTLETIIQAGQRHMTIKSIPVRVNRQLRPSRLIRSIPRYINQSILTILRIFMTYKPLRFFIIIGSIFFVGGLVLGIRFIYFLATGGGAGHIQSLILVAVLLIIGFLFGMMGLIGDIISINRRLLEDIQYKLRKLNIGQQDKKLGKKI